MLNVSKLLNYCCSCGHRLARMPKWWWWWLFCSAGPYVSMCVCAQVKSRMSVLQHWISHSIHISSASMYIYISLLYSLIFIMISDFFWMLNRKKINIRKKISWLSMMSVICCFSFCHPNATSTYAYLIPIYARILFSFLVPCILLLLWLSWILYYIWLPLMQTITSLNIYHIDIHRYTYIYIER